MKRETIKKYDTLSERDKLIVNKIIASLASKAVMDARLHDMACAIVDRDSAIHEQET